MFFLLKWVYAEMIPGGETLPKNSVSKLYNHLKEGNVWLIDYLDCYLSEDDCILCGILLSEGYKLWVKCIHSPELREDCDDKIYIQPCFLCIKCNEESNVEYLKECLVKSPHKFINLDLFLWSQSAVYDPKSIF